MPELPEVQTVVTTIRPRLLHRRIVAVNLTRPDILTPPETDLPALLAGRIFVDVARRGKRIVITLDDGNRFYIHLGMTGRLTVEKTDAPVLPHTHLVIGLGEKSGIKDRPGPAGSFGQEAHLLKGISRAARAGSSSTRTGRQTTLPAEPPLQLRFRDPRRFGGVWWLGKAPADEQMGPEPLTVTARQLASRLGRTTRALKSALLDQSVLAGLGNIYVDEALFTAGIHPLTPANRLDNSQLFRLNRAIKSTLRKAINYRGSTLRDYRDADGVPGDFQNLHRVYARNGKPCAVCKTVIERIVLVGRSTCFCPNCQPVGEERQLPGKRVKSRRRQKRP